MLLCGGMLFSVGGMVSPVPGFLDLPHPSHPSLPTAVRFFVDGIVLPRPSHSNLQTTDLITRAAARFLYILQFLLWRSLRHAEAWVSHAEGNRQPHQGQGPLQATLVL